jgi:hypothetical protein
MYWAPMSPIPSLPSEHIFLHLTLSEWAAVATIVNTLTVCVLILINIGYLRAANNQAEASLRQATAASEQVTESRAQVKLAQDNIEFLRNRLNEDLVFGRDHVLNAIKSAMIRITYWKGLPLTELRVASSFPDSHDLVPSDVAIVAEHARRISSEVGQHVTQGFDYLELARNEIERLRNANVAIPSGSYDSRPSVGPAHLANALECFENARKMI